MCHGLDGILSAMYYLFSKWLLINFIVPSGDERGYEFNHVEVYFFLLQCICHWCNVWSLFQMVLSMLLPVTEIVVYVQSCWGCLYHYLISMCNKVHYCVAYIAVLPRMHTMCIISKWTLFCHVIICTVHFATWLRESAYVLRTCFAAIPDSSFCRTS